MTNIKKIIFGILIALALSIFAGVFYLNEIVIPKYLKRSVVEEIEAATQKKVLLGSLRFSVFQGMVLKRLVLYDDANVILDIKEASCAILVMPFFKKNIIIPMIRFKSPVILLERRPDNSINLLDLVNPKYVPKHGYSVIVNRIRITDAQVKFVDDTFTPQYTQKINNLNMYLYLSQPSRAQFDLECEVGSASPIKLDSSGEYDIAGNRGTAKILVKDISLKEFSRYYDNLGISIPEGKVDAMVKLALKDDIVSADINSQTKDLIISKEKISARLNSSINAGLQYIIKDKKFIYSGNMKIDDLGISGVDYIDKAGEIKGDFKFSNSGLSSDNISAKIFGIPVEANVNSDKLDAGLLDIHIASYVKLEVLQAILKEKFNISIPADLEGGGKLNLAMQYKMPPASPPKISGSLDMADATIKMEKGRPALEKVNGTLRLEANQLMWSEVAFRCLGADYQTSGTITNFETPGVQLELSSKDLSLESVFAVNEEMITFTKFAGRYIDSNFSLTGKVDLASSSAINADIAGALDVSIDDIKVILKDFKDKLERMKAMGRVSADFNLKGNLKDIKFCAIDAKILSNSISLYGFKPTNIIIDYHQKDGIVDMPSIHSFLYGGTLDAAARIELVPKDNPYSISADIKEMRLEKLKEDTGLKDKDISGSIRIHATLNGLSNNLASLAGSGKIAVTNGKLWQLNMFKGLGALLFTSDFNEVSFKEVSAAFNIKDRTISSEGLWLTSDMINMYGSAQIDFDNNINVSLKAEITNEALESGTRKNITKAIGKYTLIDITGTLKDPKYKLKPDIGGILGDIQGAIFQ